MKKVLLIATMALTCAFLMTACNSKKFKQTENGLLYRFETTNPEGEQPQVGDLLVGELTILLEDDTMFTNVGKPDRIGQVYEECAFKGDLQEGLRMLHVGDKAIFKVPADSMARFMRPEMMPEQYKSGAGQYFYYEINLTDIVPVEELMEEQKRLSEEMEVRKNTEPDSIAAYIQANNITAKPTKSGLYVIVNKKGDGAKVVAGKNVTVKYTGCLLDGTMFDSNREADAKKGGIYSKDRNYNEPFSFVMGQNQVIPGWEEGLMGQTVGSDITLIIPSSLAYGPGRGPIPPYSPLVFTVTIDNVE